MRPWPARWKDWTAGGALTLLAQPDFTAMSHAALHANGLAVQWMPRIVNGYVLSVVGGM